MTISKEAIEAGLRTTLSSVNMPAGECLHETDVREVLEAALPFLPIAGEGKAEEQVQQEECDYHRAAEADFQNHVNYLRRAREWE